MFLKMQNFPVFGFLRISTSENEKSVRRKSLKASFSCLFSCESHCSNYILSQNMIKMYAPNFFRDNLSTKSIPASLLS